MRNIIIFHLIIFLGGCSTTESGIDLAGVEKCNIEKIHVTVLKAGIEKFKEKHSVRMGEFFYISDTNYRARVTHYTPHYIRSLSKGTVMSRSNEPVNPGIKIDLYEGDRKLSNLWYLSKMPFYHRSKKPGFGFVVDKVEFGPGGSPDFMKITYEPTAEEKARMKERGTTFHGLDYKRKMRKKMEQKRKVGMPEGHPAIPAEKEPSGNENK